MRTLAEAEAWLLAHTPYGDRVPPGPRRDDLEPIRTLLEAAGRPQEGYRVVQVVGTRGKGSTASFLAQLLARAGVRVGLYTSPHLLRLPERIRVQGREIPGDRLAGLLEEVLDLPLSRTASFFDLLTTVAALHFAREKVEVAVFEAGRGGETDATTALGAELMAFTTLGRDHLEILGQAEEARAKVKAAALRRGSTLVCGLPMGTKAQAVAAGVACIRGCPLLQAGRDFFHTGQAWGRDERRIALEWRNGREGRQPCHLRIRTLARFLDANAALAQAAALALGFPPAEPADPAMAPLLEPPLGRFQLLRADPPAVLDGAQSPEAVAALLESWQAAFPRRRPWVLLALGRDKDAPGVAAALARGGVAGVRTVQVDPARGRPAAELAELVGAAGLAAAPLAGGPETAAALLGDDRPWLATGSLYLVGFLLERWAGPGALTPPGAAGW